MASSARAAIPAASGAEADVPVCSTVQMWSGRSFASISTVATLLSLPGVPDEYVEASVELHSSRYQGLKPPCVALDIDSVNILLV